MAMPFDVSMLTTSLTGGAGRSTGTSAAQGVYGADLNSLHRFVNGAAAHGQGGAPIDPSATVAAAAAATAAAIARRHPAAGGQHHHQHQQPLSSTSGILDYPNFFDSSSAELQTMLAQGMVQLSGSNDARAQPHPLGEMCLGPNCDRTFSISWAPIPSLTADLPWTLTPAQLESLRRTQGSAFLCWHCATSPTQPQPPLSSTSSLPLHHSQQQQQQPHQQQQQHQQQHHSRGIEVGLGAGLGLGGMGGVNGLQMDLAGNGANRASGHQHTSLGAGLGDTGALGALSTNWMSLVDPAMLSSAGAAGNHSHQSQLGQHNHQQGQQSHQGHLGLHAAPPHTALPLGGYASNNTLGLTGVPAAGHTGHNGHAGLTAAAAAAAMRGLGGGAAPGGHHPTAGSAGGPSMRAPSIGTGSLPLATHSAHGRGSPDGAANNGALGRARSQGSRSSASRHKCPACLARDGEFKYFGLSVRICKACYQLWSHHDAFRQQHKETMDVHISKCIKNAASQRRLRIVYDLRASASGANPELCLHQAAETFTLLLYDCIGIENVLSSVVSNALARFPGLEVSVESLSLGRTAAENRVRLFISGPVDHVKGATIRVQSVCQVFEKCTMRLFDGKVTGVDTNGTDSKDDDRVPMTEEEQANAVAADSRRALTEAAADARARTDQRKRGPDSGHGSGGEQSGAGGDDNSGGGSGTNTPDAEGAKRSLLAQAHSHNHNSHTSHTSHTGSGEGEGEGAPPAKVARSVDGRRVAGAGEGAADEVAAAAELPLQIDGVKASAAASDKAQALGRQAASPSSSGEASDDSITSGTTTSYACDEREASIRLHGDIFSTGLLVSCIATLRNHEHLTYRVSNLSLSLRPKVVGSLDLTIKGPRPTVRSLSQHTKNMATWLSIKVSVAK